MKAGSKTGSIPAAAGQHPSPHRLVAGLPAQFQVRRFGLSLRVAARATEGSYQHARRRVAIAVIFLEEF